MIDSMTTEEWETTLGRHLRNLRLRQNVDQRRLAEQAGVALNVVKNLEAGGGNFGGWGQGQGGHCLESVV